MADDYDVNVLVNMIFDKEYFNSEEMIMQKSTIPTCLFEKDFYERMRRVLLIRSRITSCKWEKFFDTCFTHMLSSHEYYLAFVIFACFREDECQENKFESFLSVCCLVKFLGEETLKKSGVNFCDLNPDISMVFYDHQLKKVFNRRGGFQRLVEYIRDHKYLTWIENWGDLSLDNDPNMDYYILPKCLTTKNLCTKIEKELRRGRIENKTNPDDVATNTTSIDLATEVLSITPSVLPSLPSHIDIIKSVAEYRIKKMAKYSEAKKITEGAVKLESKGEDLNGSCSNSKSKTDCIEKREDNFEQHENKIQSVNKHNNSKGPSKENTKREHHVEHHENIIQAVSGNSNLKSPSNENPKNIIQEEAGVLKHLEEMIKSLNEISVSI